VNHCPFALFETDVCAYLIRWNLDSGNGSWEGWNMIHVGVTSLWILFCHWCSFLW